MIHKVLDDYVESGFLLAFGSTVNKHHGRCGTMLSHRFVDQDWNFQPVEGRISFMSWFDEGACWNPSSWDKSKLAYSVRAEVVEPNVEVVSGTLQGENEPLGFSVPIDKVLARDQRCLERSLRNPFYLGVGARFKI